MNDGVKKEVVEEVVEETTEEKLDKAIVAIVKLEADLANAQQVINGKIRKINAAVGRRKKEISDLKGKVMRVDAMVLGRKLDKAEADAEAIHEMYALAFHKTIVATEIYHLYRGTPKGYELAAAALVAFDYSDEWWKEKLDIQLNHWEPILRKINLEKNNDVMEKQWTL